MEWLQSNWVWIALGLAFVAMHLFGHGGHGHSLGSNSKRGQRDLGANDATAAPSAEHTHADGAAPTVGNPNDPALRSAPAHAGHDATVKETR